MIEILITLYGPARDLAGADRVRVELPEGATIADAAAELAIQVPGLALALGTVRFAVHEAFVPQEYVLADGNEVAVIPPVSGGSPDWIELVTPPIDLDAIRRHVEDAGGRNGGVCIFEGRTRQEEHAEYGALRALDYEAHETMAARQMSALVADARKRWLIGELAIVHRLGRVSVGEASIVIGVACAHRAEAFAACRYLINTLKRDVPIWKKEIWAGGASTWVDPTAKG